MYKGFQLGSGLLSSIPAKCYWFILFCTRLTTSFWLNKMFFWTERKETHCLLEKFIRKKQFSFFLLHFWLHFFGANNVWMLPFLVWMQPWWPVMTLMSDFFDDLKFHLLILVCLAYFRSMLYLIQDLKQILYIKCLVDKSEMNYFVESFHRFS